MGGTRNVHTQGKSFFFEREKYSFDVNSLAKIKEQIILLVLVDVCLFWSLNSYYFKGQCCRYT